MDQSLSDDENALLQYIDGASDICLDDDTIDEICGRLDLEPDRVIQAAESLAVKGLVGREGEPPCYHLWSLRPSEPLSTDFQLPF